MESVETVTIMFTDLVGSTGLETRAGPGPAHELRNEHFALIRAALDEATGREVKNTGDGVMAAFDSASAAVACAVSIQQRFEQRNRAGEIQMLVRIGISLGDATATDGDYFGLPVIEAARLCDKAQGGQILAKEVVAHLTAGREGHAFCPAGELELKGIPEPVPAVDVAWEPLGPTARAFPLPPRLQGLPPAGFVGRAAEHDLLCGLLAEAREGGRRLALISGEPGVGKTRLSTHVAVEARADGAVVLYGRADEDLAVPYGPWIEALRHYVDHASDSALREHVASHGGELTRLVPALATRVSDVPRPRDTDPDTERYLLWGAVLGLLTGASADAVLVFVLDDLHWADKPTLQLLKHVTSQAHELRALILGTFRGSEITRDHPLQELLADLRREHGVERVALKGLGEGDIVEIMQRAAGHELDAAGRRLASQLHRETDGNAFYAGEMLRHLLESGTLYQQEDGRWTVGDISDIGLPESVREVLGRRIERLGEETSRVLSAASVIGREFDVELLVRVAEIAEDPLLELLEQAATASVLNESASVPGRFVFAHALINHTLYEGLGTTRRSRLHRRVAEALEELLGGDPGDRVGELAQHWGCATATVDAPKAIDYARRAGERALAELAPEEAVRWFQRALELGSQHSGLEDEERCDLLISLGEGQRQAGEPGFRETLLQASNISSLLRDARRAARAAVTNNRGQQSSFGVVDEERISALDRALELTGETDPATRARLLSLQGLELQLGPAAERAQSLAREALNLAREAGEARALGDVLRNAILTLVGPDVPLSFRSALAKELLLLAEQLDDPALRFWGEVGLESACVERGEMAAALDAAERRRAIADEVSQPTLTWSSAYFDASFALAQGELERAERLIEEALQYGIQGSEPDALMVYGGAFAELRYMQGRSAEIVDLLVEGVEANPGMPAWRGGLAAILTGAGRYDEALTVVRDAARDGFAHVPRDQVFLSTLALYADAASQVGDPAVAETLYQQLEPYRGRVAWSAATSYGFVDPYLGLLSAVCGWDAEADEHLARGCELNEREGIRFWAASSRVGWAEALARRGDRSRARDQAQRALELARGQGYEAVEQRAEAVLARAVPAI